MNHTHCNNCIILKKCSYTQCKLIDCKQNCGFTFHQCKQLDHNNICSNFKIKCINHAFGCNFFIFRKQLREHIEICPASIVHCGNEWNRWPSHTREKRLNKFYDELVIDSLNKNSCLNISLALRDQQMLEDLYKSKKNRRLMKNNLTRKYPAVPIRPYIGLKEDKIYEEKIISNQKENSELGINEYDGFSNLNNNDDFNINDTKDLKLNELSKCNSYISTTTILSDDDSDSSPWQMHKSPPGLRKSVCEKLSSIDKPTTSCKLENLINLDENPNNSDSSKSLSNSSNNSNNDKKKYIKKIDFSTKINQLVVDLNIEFIASHHIKPRQIYTFKCAQDFRRDEISFHHQNVHNIIMSSMNGWMEKRCPLYQYGCQFIIRRIHPFPENSKIIFSQINKSFGHLMNKNLINLNETNENINLINLPTIILERIFSYLDGFSLNNLSLTNKKLRLIIANLLQKKGLVTLVWKRNKKENGKFNWVVIGKKWFFSNSFEHIKKWKFSGDELILNHISNCKYNDRILKKEPYKLVGMIKKKSNL